MNSEQAEINADIFLREIPNVKLSNVSKPEGPKPPVKEELKLLNLSNESQALVMDTLKYIHGPDFSLTSVSAYVDKSSLFTKKYWMERGNLVIKGVVDYSNVNNEPKNERDKFRMFAIMRLESYGFHKSHCVEALKRQKEIEDALELLYNKYFNVTPKEKVEHDFSEKELFEQRLDEKGVLESIYESAFKEKVVNSVWILTFHLDYLVKLFNPKKNESRASFTSFDKKKKEKCKNYVRGHCKFGNKCRFLHEDPQKEPTNPDAHLSDYSFELEIRFSKHSKYPFEAPLIFLKTNLVMPELMNLHICRRLYQEAESFAKDGIPCIYSVAELIKNDQEMTAFLTNNPVKFLGRNERLFPRESNGYTDLTEKSSHYRKGTTNKDHKKSLTMQQIIEDDRRIAIQFRNKSNDNKYKKMREFRENLPAWALKKDIVSAIESSQVLVISGETGCGKSTQVPQFILDDWLKCYEDDQKHVEIICTQPRRISAIGVAERVADERADKIGHTVGYQIRLESKTSGSTRLTFCTTGILLRRLELDPTLAKVSHIIVDEVHERSEESDFLLLILKDLLPLRPDLKVVLMSATLNAKLFSDYFGDIPVLEIPGRTFPVVQYFLEDILDVTDYILEENSQYTRNVKCGSDLDSEIESCDISSMPKDIVKDENLTIAQTLARYKGCTKTTCKNLYILDPEKVNLDLIESILVWIVSGDHEYPKTGTVLIFLPGISEITALYQQLNEHPEFSQRYGNYLLIPLHSSLTSEEQSVIFKKPKAGVRKIVISTNIAETSVTIDDCVFVIDSGKMKEKRFDSNRNMESLDTVWVSRANALQRKGRAGRVMSGVCIHLFTSYKFSYHMLPQPIPEIHRVPLEQLLLNIKVLPSFAGRSLHQVLESILEPPVIENIDSSITRLQYVGALDKENNLTPLGHHLAALPVDVKIGKLMLYGAIFGCVDAALTMAACLNYKSPFVSPFGKKDKADAKKRDFSDGYSDQLTVLKAYKKWQTTHIKSYLAGQNFANENYLSVKTLLTLADIKHQLLELLVSIGFVPVDLKSKRRTGEDRVAVITGSEFNKNGENNCLLSAILCAALYPNIVKVLTPEKSFLVGASGAVPRQPEAKNLIFRTKNEQVFLHPSSVNFIVKQFPSPYLVYQEKVRTNKIYIRDCCMVPVVPLVLFSGFDVDISVHNGVTFIVLEDGWIMVRVEDHKIAEMIKMIRLELLSLLEEKIKDPLLNLLHHDKGEKIISTILHIVTND